MKYRAIIIVSLFFILSSHANSSTISGEIFINGNRVQLSGLEWLPLDDADLGTIGVSRSNIEDTNSAWSIAGWRYATELEMQLLLISLSLDSFGSNNNPSPPIPESDPVFQSIDFLFNTWGMTFQMEFDSGGDIDGDGVLDKEFTYQINGYYGEDFIDPSEALNPLSPFFSALVTYGDCASTAEILEICPVETFQNGFGRIIEDDLNNPGLNLSIGSFLVRDAAVVPVPAAVWLFGTALIGLVGFSKRKKTA